MSLHSSCSVTRAIVRDDIRHADSDGAVGPTARASNVKRDLRVERLIRLIETFPVQMALDTRGDLEARFRGSAE